MTIGNPNPISRNAVKVIAGKLTGKKERRIFKGTRWHIRTKKSLLNINPFNTCDN